MTDPRCKSPPAFRAFLKTKKRASNYQIVLGKQTINVASLSHAQALEALCNAVDAIEEIGELLAKAGHPYNDYVNTGKISASKKKR